LDQAAHLVDRNKFAPLFTLGTQQDAWKLDAISCFIYLNMAVTTKIKAAQYFGSNLQELRTDSYVLNFVHGLARMGMLPQVSSLRIHITRTVTGGSVSTVERHSSGLIGTASHPDMQKFRIIGVFSENKLHWQFEVRLLESS
jgi:hypothetical protein